MNSYILMDLGREGLKEQDFENKNRAGQGFRMAAQSVKQADCVFGVMYRRLRARLGPAQATARVVYRMLKYKIEYETISVEEYEQKYREQQFKYMRKKAAKMGYQLVPA